MARPAPVGPLIGDEELFAIQELTDRQLRAYRYRRRGESLTWIATRMGISKTAVVHHVAKAEKRLGYEPTVTAKQKSPYKSVAARRLQADDESLHQAAEAIRQMDSQERRSFIKAADPSVDVRGLDQGDEIRLLAHIWTVAASDEEVARRLRQRLAVAARARRRIEIEDEYESSSIRDREAAAAADFEDAFGRNRNGEPMRTSDFAVDDGKGYDRV